MKGKILCMVLAIALVLIPMNAAAEQEYAVTDGVLTGYSGLGGDAVIPDGVEAIGDGAFGGCTALESAVIPDGVTSIGLAAFGGCTSLRFVTIPDSVGQIAGNAFEGCAAVTVYGSAGSAAEAYARENNIIFVDGSAPVFVLVPAFEPAPAPDAVPATARVTVDGAEKSFDAYNIRDNNYFKLRDIAYVLSGTDKQFEVGWDADNNAILLTGGMPYTAVGGEMSAGGGGTKTPARTSARIYVNGGEVELIAYNIDGSNYFKLRDIGRLFNFGLSWDGAAGMIAINTGEGYTD